MKDIFLVSVAGVDLFVHPGGDGIRPLLLLLVRQLVILDWKPRRIERGNLLRGEVFRHGEREEPTDEIELKMEELLGEL